jgi:hypothetical protein
MRRIEGLTATLLRAALALALLAGHARVAGAEPAPDNARLGHPAERMALALAIRGALVKIARPECEGLLDEFADAGGRPLRASLAAEGVGAPDYLRRVLFYDAPPEACFGLVLAGAHQAGSRVIRVCGRRFARTFSESASHAEAVVIHEMLHALGLGENPPTSAYITERVIDRCGR